MAEAAEPRPRRPGVDSGRELRRRIGQGLPCIGTFLAELRTEGAAAVLATAGWNFVMIDREHGMYSEADVARLILAAHHHGLCPLVRVRAPTHEEITPVLDAGAAGIVVPMSRSMDDVLHAVVQSKYPPVGRRSAHFMRPDTAFDPPSDPAAHMAEANRQLMTAIQIETPEAVELIEPIAAIEGVDMLYLGPGDLSIAMGIPCQNGHPRILKVAERIAAACRDQGKISMGHVGSPEDAGRFREAGIQAVGYCDAMMLFATGARAVAESLLPAGRDERTTSSRSSALSEEPSQVAGAVSSANPPQ